jgi:hypothetical protein
VSTSLEIVLSNWPRNDESSYLLKRDSLPQLGVKLLDRQESGLWNRVARDNAFSVKRGNVQVDNVIAVSEQVHVAQDEEQQLIYRPTIPKTGNPMKMERAVFLSFYRLRVDVYLVFKAKSLCQFFYDSLDTSPGSGVLMRYKSNLHGRWFSHPMVASTEACRRLIISHPAFALLEARTHFPESRDDKRRFLDLH